MMRFFDLSTKAGLTGLPFVLDWLTFEEDYAIRNKANSEI